MDNDNNDIESVNSNKEDADEDNINIESVNFNNEDTIIDPYYGYNDIESLMDEDNVREPDKAYNDILYDDIESLNFNPEDRELNLAIQNSIKDFEEEYNNAIEISKNMYYDEIENDVKKESIIIEENRLKNIEKQIRIESLSNFCKIIQRLSYTNEEIELKKYIEMVLNDYFELKIDFIKLDEEMHQKIYNLIDNYYIIPLSKKYKKTLISKNEDTILRSIFL
jgi:hypothetical protein